MFSDIIKIFVLIIAVFVVVTVLLQEGKSELSGAIGGGKSDSFLGKSKGKKASGGRISKLTSVAGILLISVVILLGTFEQRNGDWFPKIDAGETVEDPSYGKATEAETETPVQTGSTETALPTGTAATATVDATETAGDN